MGFSSPYFSFAINLHMPLIARKIILKNDHLWFYLAFIFEK